jgi:hypothetical protein
MMQPMPRLFKCLVREWIPVPEHLATAWWLSVCRAKWSLVTEWRDSFLAMARKEGPAGGNV